MSIKSILEDAKNKEKMVSVYFNSDDWSDYTVGYVDIVTDCHVRLRSVSRHGQESGYEIKELSKIVKIECDGKYEHKIECLAHNQGKFFKEVKPKYSGHLIRDALEQSLTESVFIAIWGNDPDDTLVGYVQDLSSDTVTLHLINEFGENDGISSILIEEITSINFNTQSEQIRYFLTNYKKRDKINH